jgi:hypothetical protein
MIGVGTVSLSQILKAVQPHRLFLDVIRFIPSSRAL